MHFGGVVMGRCNIQASLNFQAPSTLHGHQVSPSSCHSPSRSSSPPPQLSAQGHHQAFTNPPHIPESRVPRSNPFLRNHQPFARGALAGVCPSRPAVSPALSWLPLSRRSSCPQQFPGSAALAGASLTVASRQH